MMWLVYLKWTIEGEEWSIPCSYSSQFKLEIDCKQIFGSGLGRCQHCVQFQVSTHPFMWYSVRFHEDLVIVVCVILGAK